jgi:hypothetical protein
MVSEGMRILLDLASVILDSARRAWHTDIAQTQAFAEVFWLKDEIVYGKRAGRDTFKLLRV